MVNKFLINTYHSTAVTHETLSSFINNIAFPNTVYLPVSQTSQMLKKAIDNFGLT